MTLLPDSATLDLSLFVCTNELILLYTFAVNSDECLLTRMQEMSLDYHFTVEQEVGSSTHAFFGFNGKNNNSIYMITKIII